MPLDRRRRLPVPGAARHPAPGPGAAGAHGDHGHDAPSLAWQRRGGGAEAGVEAGLWPGRLGAGQRRAVALVGSARGPLCERGGVGPGVAVAGRPLRRGAVEFCTEALDQPGGLVRLSVGDPPRRRPPLAPAFVAVLPARRRPGRRPARRRRCRRGQPDDRPHLQPAARRRGPPGRAVDGHGGPLAHLPLLARDRPFTPGPAPLALASGLSGPANRGTLRR